MTIKSYVSQVMGGENHSLVVSRSLEAAVRDQRAYTGSTGLVSVAAGNQLYVKFANPAGSNKLAALYNRLFSNAQALANAEPLEWRAYGNPTAMLANTGGSPNLYLGGPASTAGEITYEAAAAGSIVFGGQAGSTDVMYPNIGTNRDLFVVLPPGTAVGFVISGNGGNLQQAARIGMSFDWFEEPM